jgi:DNA-binding transcriptional LysR family regulator
MMKKLDTHLLEIFVSVVEKKSLTHAGVEMNLVVSAISKRINELERHVGKSLLKRHGRGIVPTDAGELLYLHAKSILRSLRAASEALAEFGNNGIRKIRLLANQTTIVQSLPAQIASYLAETKNTSIDLIEGHSVDIPATVSDGDADVGIYHAKYPAAGVLSYPYRKDRVGLVVPKGHPLEARRAIFFEEALDYPLLGGFPRHSLDLFLELAGDSVSRPPNVVFSVSNFEARCHMVKEGVGIAMLPEDIAVRYISNLGLGMVRIEDPWAERQFYGCMREPEAEGGPASSLLMHLCRAGSGGKP